MPTYTHREMADMHLIYGMTKCNGREALSVVSRETHIPQTTVWRIAHDEGLHPYHLQRVQALELGDYNKRMDFARWFLHERDSLLGPYILPERLNGSVYLTFLQEVLPEMLNHVPMPIRQRIRFQHDRAPAYFTIDVRAHLQATFPGGWIGHGGPIALPARSPDLSPLDFSYGDF
ncbi:uncharacterized protein TNCV_970381 [Trichonephila clavipes]|nr:uncharacterized protein TNCV_970381 [Trichonephila clavipes]